MPLAIAFSPNSAVQYHRQSFDPTAFRPPFPRVQVAKNSRSKNELSKAAKKRLSAAVNWISFLSKKRRVSYGTGLEVSDFKISFVTLTLPGKQMHKHSEITKLCLNQFLVQIRRYNGVKNYVWKAELQKNGNIHYHLTIDRFVHYAKIRRLWNQAIAKLGYIKEYQSRMRPLSFDDYCYWQRQNGVHDLERLKKSFAYGQQNDWSSPNTTDVRNVKNVKDFGAYISKYLSKNIGDASKTGVVADSLDELSGRLWFCSQSLSRLGKCSVPWRIDLKRLMTTLDNVKSAYKFEMDFVKGYLFNFGKLPKMLKEFLLNALITHASMCSYPFPSSFPKNRTANYQLISQ